MKLYTLIKNSIAVTAAITCLVGASFAATVNATFENPTAGSTTSGVGTPNFTYGNGTTSLGPNTLDFIAGTFADPVVNQVFAIGTLNYLNTTTTTISTPDSVDLAINFVLDSLVVPTLNTVSTLSLISTPNTSDPQASADQVTLAAFGFTSTFNVLEGETATATVFARLVDLMGGGGLVLQVLGFGDVSGAGFITGDQIIATPVDPAAVPLPGAAILFISGALLTGGISRKRKNLKG